MEAKEKPAGGVKIPTGNDKVGETPSTESISYRLPVFFDTLFLHATLLLLIAATTISALTGLYVITAAAGIAIILNYLTKTWIASKAMKLIDEDISAWKIPFLELSEIWRNMFLNIKFTRSNKEDFIRR